MNRPNALNPRTLADAIVDTVREPLVVLDRDYFRVSDADMRKTRPILTVVDGKVVHDTGAFA